MNASADTVIWAIALVACRPDDHRPATSADIAPFLYGGIEVDTGTRSSPSST